jgi:hypothetical protein
MLCPILLQADGGRPGATKVEASVANYRGLLPSKNRWSTSENALSFK